QQMGERLGCPRSPNGRPVVGVTVHGPRWHSYRDASHDEQQLRTVHQRPSSGGSSGQLKPAASFLSLTRIRRARGNWSRGSLLPFFAGSRSPSPIHHPFNLPFFARKRYLNGSFSFLSLL